MSTQTINLRAIKGLLIANKKYQIKKVTECKYLVKSQSTNKQYVVINVLGKWSCSCPDHTYRTVICKHMIAVQMHIQDEAKKPATRRKERKPIKQDIIFRPISSYNLKHSLLVI
jgi:hypothetical protein